ncbi:hypothetical protein [Natronomonas marina]|jgi:hypothetical protein|uniref:hypothetical protein n=1 Tax=Natronomonas marina TaxID=2961939 RepID=UPI0020C9B3BE|nr:hypothetical protein [Natronomonas marina]
MGLRGTLLWPVYSLAGWADDNPLSALGVVVAVGALAALAVSTHLGTGAGADSAGEAQASGGVPVDALVETALAQPAYVVVAVLGLVVFAAYDG